METPVLITLDKPRALRWQGSSDALASSIDYTVHRLGAEIAKPRKSLYAICVFIWAGLVDRDHPYERPTDIANALQTDEQQAAALKAIRAMLLEAGLISPDPASPAEKKSTPGDETISASGPEE